MMNTRENGVKLWNTSKGEIYPSVARSLEKLIYKYNLKFNPRKMRKLNGPNEKTKLF